MQDNDVPDTITRAHPSVDVTFNPENHVVNVELHGTKNWNFAKMLLKEAVIVAERMEMAQLHQMAMAQQQGMQMAQRLGL